MSEHTQSSHGPDITAADSCRECRLQRVEPMLSQHAGHGPSGTNDGSVRGVLKAWGLVPEYFAESLLGWGYTIVPAPSSKQVAQPAESGE